MPPEPVVGAVGVHDLLAGWRKSLQRELAPAGERQPVARGSAIIAARWEQERKVRASGDDHEASLASLPPATAVITDRDRGEPAVRPIRVVIAEDSYLIRD